MPRAPEFRAINPGLYYEETGTFCQRLFVVSMGLLLLPIIMPILQTVACTTVSMLQTSFVLIGAFAIGVIGMRKFVIWISTQGR